MGQPQVSVVVPVFNQRRFLRLALLSLLKDNQYPLEVIVVDDGSTDDCIKTISDLPVKIIRTERNFGPAHAQNLGMDAATGEWITFLDQDDLLVTHGIKWRVEWLRNHPESSIVMGSVAGIIDERNVASRSYRFLLKKRILRMPEVITLDHFRRGGWMPLSPLSLCVARRDLLARVGRLDEELSRVHDRDYLYRILRETTIPFVDRPVLFYRLHDNNLSITISNGRIQPNRRTIAELCLIHLDHGLPLPA